MWIEEGEVKREQATSPEEQQSRTLKEDPKWGRREEDPMAFWGLER